MEKVKSVLLCLVSLISLVYCDVLDIKNVCKLEQNLDFIPKGYSCTFVGGNVYVYQGKPSIETIYFDTFNANSTLIILGVKTVVIKRGSMDTCHQLVTRNPEASIIINEQNCEYVTGISSSSTTVVHTPKTKVKQTSSMSSSSGIPEPMINFLYRQLNPYSVRSDWKSQKNSIMSTPGCIQQ
ncbi:unnamed protein product [Mytilus coruscus]|uniref:Uncharacterized protein n=1 Tax=Mytilus coruscus TaxID=42192 RepID=A0A6J8E9F9_MYTCO|nr:unnamed protein product [Mytilus coruscus]